MHWTAHRTDVLAVADRLRRLPGEAERVVPRDVALLYLVGSFATGAADHLSDVDVLYVTRDPLPDRRDADLARVTAERISEFLSVPADVVHADSYRFFPAPNLRVAVGRGRLLACRDRALADAFERALFPGGVRPDPASWERALWLLRARRVIDGWHPPFMARAAISLGHQALRVLGLAVPDRADDIPWTLARAGVVRPVEAEWVALARAVDADGFAGDRVRTLRLLMDTTDMARDFAWHVQMALERACLGARAEGTSTSGVGPGASGLPGHPAAAGRADLV